MYKLVARVFMLSQLMMAPMPSSAGAQVRTATITIPSNALVFSGPGLQRPDTEGHFTIGLRLPQRSIKAKRCETSNLIIGIGTLNKPETQLTNADRKLIDRNNDYYNRLLDAASRNILISIPIRNLSSYLVVKNGIIVAPYCTLSIDESRLP